MRVIQCPYCGRYSVNFTYSEVKAIYRTDENGYPVSLPEDTTNHYHCNNCHQEFSTDGAGRLKGALPLENSDKIQTAPHFKRETIEIQSIKVPDDQKNCTQGKIDENSIDQKLDKIIDLLEQLIAKL